MNDELQNTLSKLIKSGWQSNSAMQTLINDYARYHAVLVIVGGCLLLIFILLSIVFWARFKKTPGAGRLKWGFEKKVYFSFGLLSSIVALCMALIVVANATNAFDPLDGFSLLVGSLDTSGNSVYSNELGQAFNEWIKSGNGTIPPLIEEQIHERIAFHTTKAIVCGILLVVCVALSVLLWRALIKKTRVSESQWRLKETIFLVSGSATVALSLLMMVIVVANMQGAFAPIAQMLLSV